MGLTLYYLAQTLDGYIAERDGGLDWLLHFGGQSEVDTTEATDGTYDRFYAEIGAVAMGSTTYEIVLRHGEWPYSGTPSWVFTSRGLTVPEGADVRLVNGPVRPVHEEMRAAAGERNVWIVGGGDLAMQFVEEDLLDELLVTIVPVVLGEGIPTFPGRLHQQLRLTGTQPFRNGMVELRYAFER